MTKFVITYCLSLLCWKHLPAQENDTLRRMGSYFDRAYRENPTVPRGILEAVAFSNTRIQFIKHEAGEPESCTGMPRVYGVMGLMEDGKNVFRNNLLTIAGYSDSPVQKIKRDTMTNILAFARAYTYLQKRNFNFVNPEKIEEQVNILKALSELPDGENLINDSAANYPLDYHLYTVYSFLNSRHFQDVYHFRTYKVNFDTVFKDKHRLQMLRAPSIAIEEGHLPASIISSAEYGPADWIPASTCNYSIGRPAKITAIVIHDIEGSYAGCIGWFKACPCTKEQCGHCPPGTRQCEGGKPVPASSAHYIVSYLGQVTQMVKEADKAFHARSANGYTVGIEHEGYCRNASFPSTLYEASANLVRDLGTRYGIDVHTTFNGQGCPCDPKINCEKPASILVKGHQMYPDQTHTDPGPNWNWPLYYQWINR